MCVFLAADNSYERYYWSAGILALVLPIVYYVFCRTRGKTLLSREETTFTKRFRIRASVPCVVRWYT